MKGKVRNSLLSVSTVVPQADEELLLEVLNNHFPGRAASYTDLESRRTTVTVFLDQRTDWTKPVQKAVAGEWSQVSKRKGALKFTTSVVRKRQWAEAWKRHFKPLRIGRELIIKPPWSRVAASVNAKVVVLEPGLSFGTGQHPTTGFCLEEIARFTEKNRSFLDIGTGSGILAIAAAKLGFRPIEAFDIDPESIRVAKANAARNRVPHKIRFSLRDLAKSSSPVRFDLVCANLISNVLIEHRDTILKMVKPGGTLVLAGILDREFGTVAAAFRNAGLTIVRDKAQNEWRSGAFRVP